MKRSIVPAAGEERFRRGLRPAEVARDICVSARVDRHQGNMSCNVKIFHLVSTAVMACSALLGTEASAQGVKIGILNDQSGVYADFGGKGSIEAAKMAIEDFGGSLLGQKIELVSADHQNKPDLAVCVSAWA